jgi:hypothetical protein
MNTCRWSEEQMHAKQVMRGDGPMRALIITVSALIFAAG